MYFIERIFGFSPDGGSGGLELLVIALPLALAAWRARRAVTLHRASAP